jgi:Protein of unknown function (DUF1360)
VTGWDTVLRFLIAALAAWRVSHMLACEDGPWDILARLRRRLGPGVLGKMMDCFQCLSIWIAIPFALYLHPSPVEFLVVWPAISGAACLLEGARPEPVIVERLPSGKGDPSDGLLR